MTGVDGLIRWGNLLFTPTSFHDLQHNGVIPMQVKYTHKLPHPTPLKYTAGDMVMTETGNVGVVVEDNRSGELRIVEFVPTLGGGRKAVMRSYTMDLKGKHWARITHLTPGSTVVLTAT